MAEGRLLRRSHHLCLPVHTYTLRPPFFHPTKNDRVTCPTRTAHEPAGLLRGQLTPPDFLCARPEIGWRGDPPATADLAAGMDAIPGGERKVVLCPAGTDGKLAASVPGLVGPVPTPLEPARPAVRFFTPLLDWMPRFTGLTDRFAPPGSDAEVKRRVFLFIAFSVQGVGFGTLFALFYLGIGPPLGRADGVPLHGGDDDCAVGDPLRGSERRGQPVRGWCWWPASRRSRRWKAAFMGTRWRGWPWCPCAPVCWWASRRPRFWCGVCLGIMGVFCILSLRGIQVPRLYPMRWEPVITASGYLSLTIFMATIGVSFEKSRRRSLLKVHDTLEALSEANERLQRAGQGAPRVPGHGRARSAQPPEHDHRLCTVGAAAQPANRSAPT